MTPVGVFFCWQGGAERDFVNSTKLSRIFEKRPADGSRRGGLTGSLALRWTRRAPNMAKAAVSGFWGVLPLIT